MAIYILWVVAVAFGAAALILWLQNYREIGIWIGCLSAITITAAIADCLFYSHSIISDVNAASANASDASQGNNKSDQALRNANEPTTVKSSQNSSATEPSANQEYTKTDSKDNQKDNGFNHISTLLLIVNSVMAVATAFLALFAFAQVRVAKDTAKRQLRAYVVLDHCYPVDLMTATTPVTLGIQFRNSGQTPAYNLRYISYRTSFGKHPDISSPNLVSNKESRFRKGDITKSCG